MVDLFRKKKWDLVGQRWLWFLITGISIFICIAALGLRRSTRGMPLNYGIDFTGGGIITLLVTPPVTPGQEVAKTEEIRATLEKAGLRVQVQLASGTVGQARDQIIIRTQLPPGQSGSEAVASQAENAQQVLRSQFAAVELLDKNIVTPVVSKELTTNAVWAVALGCLAIVIWIFLRYDFGAGLIPKYGLCAIFALAHDLILLTGIFAIVWWVVDSPFVAAFLTVLGYSVHDTIIIFDRIRENVKLRKRPTFPEIVNLSLLETMARSVNTVLTVEFVLIALYLFGGVTLRSFAGALIIGITSGAWSSIFIASQLLVSWKKREERGKVAAVTPRAAKAAPPSPRPARRAAPQAEAKTADLAVTAAVPADSDGAARGGKKLRGKKRHRRF